MTSFRLLAITACLATALLSGCASDDDSGDGTNTSGMDTTGTMTGTTTSGTGNPPVDNATLEERRCTATAGGPGNGYAGDPSGTVYVGGCPFGTSDVDAILHSAELPSGCEPYHAEPGAGPADAMPAAVGTSYPAGTRFMMFCGPGGVDIEGIIQLQPTA